MKSKREFELTEFERPSKIRWREISKNAVTAPEGGYDLEPDGAGDAAIRELRETNWIAAHIRERRFELNLTQKDVAVAAGTSHSFISKVEKGDHIPTILVLKRVLAVLDEELLIGIEHREVGEDPEREVAPVPEVAAA